MIFSQIAANIQAEIASTPSHDFWFYVEITILIIIAIIQLGHSFLVYININELKNIFNYRLLIKNGFVEKTKLGSIENDSNEILYDKIGEESLSEITGNDIIKLSLVDTKGKSAILNRIKNVLNTYLINNYGAAVNFSIIKDIIDREVDVKDEDISQSITVPLYLGLAATMIGIILGLWSMPSLNDDNFSDGVNALITGVQWAMLASLLGLFCTTILSSFFYKQAKRKVLREKNDQLSYLQAKLLPELIKAEDTGVSGLKASLDRFARVATNISDNVLIASNQTGENLVLQQEVIDKIEKLDFHKVSKHNLELFDQLDNNMDAMNKFSTYVSNMEKISLNLLEFANRTSNIDLLISNMDSNLKDSKQLSQFLSAHFSKIEASGSAALKSVGLAESHFENAIESLKTRTDEMINQLYSSSGKHEIKLEQIYGEIESNLNKITTTYINSFSEAFSESIPKFDQLDNLNLLPDIKTESNANIQLLIENVEQLKTSLKSLQGNFNSQEIERTLGSIDKNLRNNRPQRMNSESSKVKSNGIDVKKENANSVHKPKTLSIGYVIKKIFKKP